MERSGSNQNQYDNIDDLDQETVKMLEEYGAENPELVRDIFDSFVPEAQDLIEKMEVAVLARDFNELRLHAHAMAGISGSIGAMRLKKISSDIEKAIKSDNMGQALLTYTFIKEAFHNVIHLLKSSAEE